MDIGEKCHFFDRHLITKYLEIVNGYNIHTCVMEFVKDVYFFIPF